MPSDGKSSHCLWQGELKKKYTVPNFVFLKTKLDLGFSTQNWLKLKFGFKV
jgi:hypothetical protein